MKTMTLSTPPLSPYRSPRALLYGLMLGAYLLWSITFIGRSSFEVEGQRMYALFEDAMISMRYAWNFVQGHGLVWNVGEAPVEGYTNFLWVMVMASQIALFGRVEGVLAVQVVGMLILCANALLSVGLLRVVRRRLGLPPSLFAEALLLAFTLLYYPSSYWGLMGMETSLVTLWALLALRLALGQDEAQARALPWLGVVLGLAFWTRPDALALGALLLAYRAYALGLRAWRAWLTEGLIVLAFVAALSLFRLAYYGALVPNTYTLKVEGMPLLPRLRDGLGFIAPYLLTTAPLLALGLLGLAEGLRAWWRQVRADWRAWWRLDTAQRTLALLALVVILHIAYQIWTGGDPWPYWRMLVPAMPSLFILVTLGLGWLMARLPARLGQLGALALAAFGLGVAVQPFAPELTLRKGAYHVGYHIILAERAVLLNDILEPGARLAVVAAGIVPYYTDFYVIDMLGKNDAYIASLPPDRSGAVSWHGMNSVPGHNKYDLAYSIETQQATYAERLAWGRSGLDVPRMTQIDLGRPSFFLDLSSPYVDQAALQARLAQAQGAATSP
jgi:hypothetical protein